MRFFHPNLVFIWTTLLNKRGRALAWQVFALVLAGSALAAASPYGIGLLVDAISKKSIPLLTTGIITYFAIEVAASLVGFFRMRRRELMFQENFWHMPQMLSKLFFARPMAMMTQDQSTIDGGGIESMKDKAWAILSSHIFSVFPNYSLALFSTVACFTAHVYLGILVSVYICIDMFIAKRQNAYMLALTEPIVDLFKKWERRIREWWYASSFVKQNGCEERIVTHVRDDIMPALILDDKIWRRVFPWIIMGRRTFGQAYAAALYIGMGYAVLEGTVTIPGVVLCIFSFEKIRSVLEDISDQQREISRQLSHITKYRQVLEAPLPFAHDVGSELTEPHISLSLRGVTHHVQDEKGGTKDILKGVSLEITAGSKVGIVGPSGAGKSQLVGLFTRATDPVSGTVLVSGHDIKTLHLSSLLSKVGVIPQKCDLMEGTLRENVMAGLSLTDYQALLDRPDCDDIIWLALHKAGLDMKSQLPHGLDTRVGHRGLKLSGGQQSRVRIAGMHVKIASHNGPRPRLVIADEPTASLDSLSEVRVLEHLSDGVPEGTTIIMIAHRLSTLLGMDEIIFVRPLESLGEGEEQVTVHKSLAELYVSSQLFREMADAQGFVP